MHLLNVSLIASFLSLFNVYALAQTAPSLLDHKQPVTIQSDTLKASEKAGKSEYQGNVIVTQGSLTIKGQKIVVSHPNGELNQAITTGNPAYFKRQNQTDQSWVEGQADTIEYNPKAKTSRLTGKAQVRQPGKHEIKGSTLFYDLEKQLLEAQKSSDEDKRVSVTFTPNTSSDSE